MEESKYIIKNSSEVTLERLEELKKSGVVTIIIQDEENEERYKIDDFIEIKRRILEYISGIPKISNNDSNGKKKIFTYLYMKIAENIEYDDLACKYANSGGYDREMSSNYVENANNLMGGLLNGKSLCRGYSEILRNLLAEVGIKAIVIRGGGKTIGDRIPSHAWNQVYLDGKWYNCDITNDADFIKAGLKLPLFLKSNEEFDRYKLYPCKNPKMVQVANESISDELQEQLIEEQRKNLNKEKELIKNTETIPKSETFLKRLQEFFKIEKEKGDNCL